MQKLNWCRLLAAGLLSGSLIAGCSMEGEFAEAVDSTHAPLVSAPAGRAIPGSYIVVMKDSVSATSASATMNRIALDANSRVERTYSVINGFAATLSPAALRDLRKDPNVAYVEEDQVMSINTVFNAPADGIDRADQRQGRNSQYDDRNRNGAGVHLYVVDTGIRGTHNEFINPNRMGAGFTAINDGRGTTDCNGHGSHVASSAAGNQFGMAKGATLHPVRVLACNGSGSNTGVIAGVDFVRTNCPTQGGRCVANMSLGGGASTALDNAVTNAVNAGVAFAVAAGNETQNACNVSPARAPAAITVGAVADNDAIASFSNFGTCVDIMAPGVTILGADDNSNTATQSISGTSMASPHVAGAAAQFLGANPGSTPAQIEAALEGNATQNCLTGLPAGTPNLYLFIGFGEAPFSCGGGGGGVPDDSCEGRCGGQAPAGCFCDSACSSFGDCCPDKVAECG